MVNLIINYFLRLTTGSYYSASNIRPLTGVLFYILNMIKHNHKPELAALISPVIELRDIHVDKHVSNFPFLLNDGLLVT